MISLKLPACTHLGEGSVKTVPEIIRRENAKKVVVFTESGRAAVRRMRRAAA